MGSGNDAHVQFDACQPTQQQLGRKYAGWSVARI